MGIRDLTPAELEQIKTVKDSANAHLRELRVQLRKGKRVLTRQERLNIENHLAALAAPSGKPVVLVVEDEEIYLNYELLKKFLKSLDKHRFWYNLCINGLDYDRKLTISYGRGSAVLCELPPRQRDLLQGLPRVEIKASH